MKIHLRKQIYHSRKEKFKIFMRWSSYSMILLIFYTMMSGGFFDNWQPIFIIPLALAVGMHENEIQSGIFGMVCGFMLDTACGYLFGMSSLWLMPASACVSVLIMNLVRINFINHLWMTAITASIMGFMDYFFNYLIWGRPNNLIIFKEYILPSYGFAVLSSPLIYLLIKVIYNLFSLKENTGEIGDVNNSADSEIGDSLS